MEPQTSPNCLIQDNHGNKYHTMTSLQLLSYLQIKIEMVQHTHPQTYTRHIHNYEGLSEGPLRIHKPCSKNP